jgi:hypothetical protein
MYVAPQSYAEEVSSVSAAPPLPASAYDHVGIVVNDTVRAAHRWADVLGIEVPSTFNNAGPSGNLTYMGVHTDANILGAYIGCNPYSGLELLEPTDEAPSFWLDQYRQHGTSPLYMGFASDRWTEADLDAKRRDFTRVGCPTDQIGYWWQTKTARGCYHYMDCRATAFGANVEVMTRTNCAPVGGLQRPKVSARAAARAVPRLGSALSPALSCATMSSVALVVPNASATLAEYASAFGAGAPPPLRRTGGGGTTYRNLSTAAAAWWAELPLHDGFALRVYQPADAHPGWWSDGLQRFGPTVLLLGFTVADVDATLQLAALHGLGVLQRGGCYAYLDSLDALGVVVEVTACR